MKKICILALAVLLPFLSSAQQFDKYEQMKEVDAVVITSKMFKLLTRIDLDSQDPETQEYINLVESLEELKVFSSKSNDVRQQMKADVSTFIANGSLEELMRVSTDGKSVNFYYTPGSSDDYVSQLFMYMDGREENLSVIMNITGNINLSQVSKLANDFNIPGGDELENIENN